LTRRFDLKTKDIIRSPTAGPCIAATHSFLCADSDQPETLPVVGDRFPAELCERRHQEFRSTQETHTLINIPSLVSFISSHL